MRPGVRIGVDVGSVRVGVARCDPAGVLATPVCTLTRSGEPPGRRPRGEREAPPGGAGVPGAGPAPGDPDIRELAGIVRDAGAIEVVVGLPTTLAGEEGTAAQRARQYAHLLAQCVAPVPVRLVDERLSTVDAHRALRESGVAARRARPVVDQVAAVIILQSALDAERSSGRPPGRPVGGRKPRSKDGQR